MSQNGIPEKVVFVCTTYLPRVTGVATVLHTWTRQLARLGTSVTIVAPDYPAAPYYPPPVYPEGLEVVRLPSRPAALVQGIQTATASGPAWEQLVAGLKGRRAVVHGQDVVLAGSIAVKLGRSAGVPVLLHGHYPLGKGDYCDWLPFPIPQRMRPALNNAASRASVHKARGVCRAASLVAVVSPYVAEVYRAARVAEPILVPCGMEYPQQPAALDIRKRHGLPADAPLFTYVGRLDPDKQIGDLLAAVALIRRKEPRARLLLVGGGPYVPRYQKKAEAMRLGDAVIFTGWVPYRDVWAYYEQSDLFLITSPFEAQALVAIESQAGGLPVVGYRGGGVGLAIEEGRTGVLTDHTPEALAESAVALWREPERRQAMREAGRERAARYDIDRMFPLLLDAYQRVLSTA